MRQERAVLSTVQDQPDLHGPAVFPSASHAFWDARAHLTLNLRQMHETGQVRAFIDWPGERTRFVTAGRNEAEFVALHLLGRLPEVGELVHQDVTLLTPEGRQDRRALRQQEARGHLIWMGVPAGYGRQPSVRLASCTAWVRFWDALISRAPQGRVRFS